MDEGESKFRSTSRNGRRGGGCDNGCHNLRRIRRMDPQHDFTPSCSSLTRCISAGAGYSGRFGHGEYIDVCARRGDTEQLRKRVLQGFADREHIDISVRVQLGRVDRGDGEAKIVRLARHDFGVVLHLLGSTAPRRFCLGDLAQLHSHLRSVGQIRVQVICPVHSTL